jgi:hypothetical protein
MAHDTDPDTEQQALLEAARAVLEPLARLTVARGVPYAVLKDLLARAVVDAAAAAHPQLAPHRRVSRIATATGINRREVTRLTQGAPRARRRSRSIASEVFAHWQATPAYLDADGRPRALARVGPAPSFESLAQEVTRDVHPRSLLDELLRLELAELDAAADTVTLKREGFVPGGDRRRMLQLLGDNVGDHAAAAVDNVLGDGRRHFEQAVFADGLSEASMRQLKRLVGAQWKLLLEAFVPPLEKMIEADAGQPAPRRVRIGLYAYDEALPGTAPPDGGEAATAPPTPTPPNTPNTPNTATAAPAPRRRTRKHPRVSRRP